MCRGVQGFQKFAATPATPATQLDLEVLYAIRHGTAGRRALALLTGVGGFAGDHVRIRHMPYHDERRRVTASEIKRLPPWVRSRVKACEHCGSFYVASRYAADTTRFCSEACVADAQRSTRAVREGRPARLVCEHCGGTFMSRRAHSRFCSGACRTAAYRAKR